MATRRMTKSVRPRSVPEIPGPTPKPKPPKPPRKPTPPVGGVTFPPVGPRPKPPKPPTPPKTNPWRDDYDNSKTTVTMRQDSGAGGTYGRPAYKKVTTTAGYSRLTGKQTVKPSTSTTRYDYNAGSGRAPYSKGTPVKRRSAPKTPVRGVSSRGTRKTSI